MSSLRDRLNRPDVAILVFDLAGSGVVRNVLRIAEASAAAGLKTDLVIVRREGPFKLALPKGVTLRVLSEVGGWLGRPLAMAIATPALRRYLKTRRPRLLFSAGSHIHHIAALAVQGLEHRPKLVMRVSNDIAHRRVTGVAAALSGPRAALFRFGLRHIFKPADRLLAVSQELGERLERDLGLPRAQISIIPNGVDAKSIAHFATESLDDPWFGPDQPPVILGVGRLVRQKNFALLIEAFARARSHRPLRLLILGHGQPEARAALLRRAQALGVGEDVRLDGFNTNPYKYMSRAAVFALSSSWEGMSNVVLEAMACGCPVVATQCPTGTTEVLDGGRFGPLTPIEDPDALAAAILARLSAPRDSARLIERARHYDQNQTQLAYVATFAEMLSLPDVAFNATALFSSSGFEQAA